MELFPRARPAGATHANLPSSSLHGPLGKGITFDMRQFPQAQRRTPSLVLSAPTVFDRYQLPQVQYISLLFPFASTEAVPLSSRSLTARRNNTVSEADVTCSDIDGTCWQIFASPFLKHPVAAANGSDNRNCTKHQEHPMHPLHSCKAQLGG